MTKTDRDAAAVRFPPPLLYLISIGLGIALHRYVHPWPLSGIGGQVRAILGVAVIAGGIGLGALAIGLFKRSGQHPEPWKPTPSILTDGIYAYTRNPMYLALALAQLGIGIAAGNLWVVVLIPLSLVAVYFVAVRHEEAYLERKFGDEYLRYKARVRRWI